MPEVLVIGARVLNMDIRRSEDDAQPYVVFDSELIERSGANNLEDFFKNELTMSVSPSTGSQDPAGGGVSAVNLRGLGSDETLILVDGRRMAPLNLNGSQLQAGMNSIPISAIERVEVLPTTAAGIYGGGATGGVINVVLRRDYSGFETNLTFGNTFGSDLTNRRVDLGAGFNLGSGTNILMAASYADANAFLAREREFYERGRRHILSTNPTFYASRATPPLGSTANLCSAANPFLGFCDGTPLLMDDGTLLSSSIASIPRGYAGASTDGGAALAAAAGQYNLDLPDTAQADGRASALLSKPTLKSGMVTARHNFTPGVQAFLDLQAADASTSSPYSGAVTSTVAIAGNAPNNPFQQNILVTYPAVGLDGEFRAKNESRKVVAGVIVQLPARWNAELDLSWDRARYSYEYPNAVSAETLGSFTVGSLNVLRDVNQYPIALETSPFAAITASPSEGTLKSAALRVAGPLPWSLPGGSLVLSTLAEHRDESFGEVMVSNIIEGNYISPERKQTVSSGYIELLAPIVSGANKLRGVDLLEVQVALRGERYEVRPTTGLINLQSPAVVEPLGNKQTSIDPTVGLRYQPVSDLTLRASFGTGFKPPSMTEIAPDAPRLIDLAGTVTDPLRGNEPVGVVTLLSGGNPGLSSEKSESWSAGMIVRPRWVEGLRFSADWSRITKTDNIGGIGSWSQAGLNEALLLFPERFARGPASGGFGVGPITQIDYRYENLARLKVESLDLALDYQMSTSRFGSFYGAARATNLLTAETQATPFSAYVENAGVIATGNDAGGIRWKANASLSWSYQGLELGWRTRFLDSYYLNVFHTVDPNQGSAKVPNQTYHDLVGSYSFSESSKPVLRMLGGMEFQFGINNIFNKAPPIDVGSVFNFYYSPYGDPRMANYYLSVRTAFGR